jgi:hypothetical protein
MGRREDPPLPTVIFTPEVSEETVLAAWTPTASSCPYRLTLGVYAAGGQDGASLSDPLTLAEYVTQCPKISVR